MIVLVILTFTWIAIPRHMDILKSMPNLPIRTMDTFSQFAILF